MQNNQYYSRPIHNQLQAYQQQQPYQPPRVPFQQIHPQQQQQAKPQPPNRIPYLNQQQQQLNYPYNQPVFNEQQKRGHSKTYQGRQQPYQQQVKVQQNKYQQQPYQQQYYPPSFQNYNQGKQLQDQQQNIYIVNESENNANENQSPTNLLSPNFKDKLEQLQAKFFNTVDKSDNKSNFYSKSQTPVLASQTADNFYKQPLQDKSQQQQQEKLNISRQELDVNFKNAFNRSEQLRNQYLQQKSVNLQQTPNQQQQQQQQQYQQSDRNQQQQQNVRQLAKTYDDGYLYDGEVNRSGQRNGYGIYKNVEGKLIYRGDWAEDIYQGSGELFNEDPFYFTDAVDFRDLNNLDTKWVSYCGEFKDGTMEGFGTLKISNGERLVGNFRDGKVNGQATYYKLDSDQIIGIWRDNFFIGSSYD